MPAGIAIALAVVIIVAVVLVVADNARNREKGPARIDWYSKWVVYGTCTWDLSRFPASGLKVQLFARHAFGNQVKLKEWTTQSDGWFECVTNSPESDVFLRVLILNGDGTTQVLLDDQDTLIRQSEPHRHDLIVMTPAQLTVRPSFVERGKVTVSGPAISVQVAVVPTSGSNIVVLGPLAAEIQLLASAIIEVRGTFRDTGAYGVRRVDVTEYVILDIGGGVVPYRGWLTVKNAVWTTGSDSPTTMTSGKLVLTDRRERIELQTPSSTYSRLSGKIRYPDVGPPMWAVGSIESPDVLAVTRYGVLE